MPSSIERSYVFHRSRRASMPSIDHGAGAVLWDRRGRRYIDGSGGACVVNIGHGRREVASAIEAQARVVAYVHPTQFTSDAVEHYARRLAAHVPGDCNRLYLVSGGSEANETAIKLARAYHVATNSPRRHKVIRRSVSYHGGTLATLALSGRATLRAAYTPMLASAPQVPAPFCYHCPLDQSYPSCRVACADDLERVIRQEDPDTVAAFIAEPVIGASAGAAVPPDQYARAAREICSKYGVLYIDDEVMTGFGRTGRWFAIEWSGVVPDIITCGKGMAGGYMPVGAVLTTDRVVDAVNGAGGFAHGFTFSHNPVTATACLTTLQVLEDEGLVERVGVSGKRLHDLLAPLASHPHVGDVRGRGLFAGVEIVADKTTRRPFVRAEKRAESVAERAFENGLIVYPSGGCADGENGDVILIAPPFVASDAEIGEIAGIMDRTLTELNL
jgi:adenosylmethionine-8-amino-7-oxononanoate aminotransferase